LSTFVTRRPVDHILDALKQGFGRIADEVKNPVMEIDGDLIGSQGNLIHTNPAHPVHIIACSAKLLLCSCRWPVRDCFHEGFSSHAGCDRMQRKHYQRYHAPDCIRSHCTLFPR